MKKIISIIFCFLFLSANIAFSKTMDSKNFSISADNAFMITLGALNKLDFTIVEMQAESGYILFRTPSLDEYLIMITTISDVASNIKISRVNQNSPISEIQTAVYGAINNDLYNLPKKVEQQWNMRFVLLI